MVQDIMPKIFYGTTPNGFEARRAEEFFRWYHYLSHLVESWSTFLWKVLKTETLKLATTCFRGPDLLSFVIVFPNSCNCVPQKSCQFVISSTSSGTGSISLSTGSTNVCARYHLSVLLI